MKVLRVSMPDSSVWEVPVSIINDDRNAYYRGREADFEDEDADDYDLKDWAENNMNWSEVEPHARLHKPASCNFQEGWVNGDKEVVEVATTPR